METSQLSPLPPPLSMPDRGGRGGDVSPVRQPASGNPLPEPATAGGAGSAPAVRAAGGEASSRQVEDAVDRINDFIQTVRRDLEFSVDEDTGRTVIKVFDSETEELIRQFPPDELLAIAAHLEEVRGLLFKERA
ncbi:hypothetical protein CKO35_16710 [Ectothiorhodospira shaposhnikovii]|uniref:flagellar protein FlaG n=1 Tax=Ectothiorhodospira shaposhnikovii TaxID=1054 RepID=UPI001F5BBADF|nr:flagellar protein FlaG [Ectothiorhodospira shaposhnikovii]MBK1674896.1 hypothetical protein [Ectothiorhodospira shaposhnikovii]